MQNHIASQTLNQAFFASEDVVGIASELIGCLLISEIEGKICSGKITECEAYRAPEDRASHAFNWRRTQRNETMYDEPGTIYMYICYGIHRMLNVVTGPKNLPHAILIRSIQPVEGQEWMLARRSMKSIHPSLCCGPGNLSVALGLGMDLNGLKFGDQSPLRIAKRSPEINTDMITATPRIGVESSGESASWLYRFVLNSSQFYSAKSFTAKYL